jgi:hypothetical protein
MLTLEERDTNDETQTMKALDEALQREVTRKEFLGVAGLGVASIFGLGTIIKLLTGKSTTAHMKHYTSGFGSADYGGKKIVSSSKL